VVYNRAAMSPAPPRPVVPGRAHVIVNPAAGGAGRRAQIGAAVGVLAEHGWTVSLHRTEGPGHARALAESWSHSGATAVIVAGGDGTVNEVVNGLAGSGTALGVLPAGTGNVLAAQLGLIGVPTPLHRGDLPGSAAALCRAQVRRVDLGRVRPRGGAPRLFALWAGIGFDAEITHALEGPSHDLKKALGPVAFGAVGLRNAITLAGTASHVRFDRRCRTGPLLVAVVANVPLYGGALELTPGARMDDGELDAVVVFGESMLAAAAPLGALVAGRAAEDASTAAGRARRVRIVSRQPLPVHLDAEPFGTTPVTIEVVPACLDLLVPPSAPAALFAEPRSAGV
jgi:diacylglycerol kinase (ATP)